MRKPPRSFRVLIAAALAFACVLVVPPTMAHAATCSQAYLPLPDPSCQPGATYSGVTQSNIGSTICVSGWTKTVRPSTSYTNALKTTQISQYGYSDTSLSDYEEDHLIPLELGGAPKDAANLWPEPHATVNGGSSSKKDTIENKLKAMVCAGTITLAAARSAIAKNWTTALSVVSAAATSGGVAVTNPGSQAGTVGVATSLQLTATDSATGTLAYSASGLPGGLSIGASTGLVTGTPTASGTYSATVTGTDSTGVSGSATFTWTVSASGVCTSAQLLGNPGFETGTASPWGSTDYVINNSNDEPANTGDWDAWLDGYGSTHTDTLSQTVALPSGCAATFSYYLSIDTDETTTTTAYDTLTVQVLNSSGTVLGTLATYSNLDAGTAYVKHSFSLSGYAGQTVTVLFTGAEDYVDQTSFVVDDAAVTG
ncbi:MAG TPA: putative Ig domain-containing protein [Rugosimonospora sp.]|nr:putative Ig domain-containing protein [Rugosimonospora sp.]